MLFKLNYLINPNQDSMRLSISIFLICATLISAGLAGCGPSTQELEAVEYTPLPGEDWEVSTPEEQGLDPMLVAELYHNAADLETLYGVLVVKNGYLIAEDYFHVGSVGRKNLLQSASKSYLSALVGIALDKGCLLNVDEKMVDFYPELTGQITDPRKQQITIREMLQMRTGYPDEETDEAYLDALYWGDYLHLIEDFPLVSDPGSKFNYSNLTFNWLAILLARACGTDLKSFAQEYLFQPMDTDLEKWLQDRDGNYIGSGGIYVTTRDAAKFGWLFLNDGAYAGQQIVPSGWVHDSLQTYSENARDYGMGFSFRDLGYGYGWWTARAGEHEFSFAWGHGGQLIVLLDDLDMVIVTTADPFFGQHSDESWTHEKATLNLVGNFINSLPSD